MTSGAFGTKVSEPGGECKRVGSPIGPPMVKVRSFPAIHSGGGSVSYALEWNGLKLVFGGDTFPNKCSIKYANKADFVVHECFHLPKQMVERYNQAPPVALYVATQIHTSPQAFGKIMSTINPRHSVAYHFFNTSWGRACKLAISSAALCWPARPAMKKLQFCKSGRTFPPQ